MIRSNHLMLVPFALIPVMAGCEKHHQPPNIIFLLTDDHRFDAMGYAGNPFIKTPNIDGLARKGIVFKNAFVTTSISCVSRASILSGQYASRHGINDFTTDMSEAAVVQTYPILLKEKAGYRIGFIGKYGVGLKNQPASKYDYWGCEQVIQPVYEHYDSTGKMTHYTDILDGRIKEFLGKYAKSGPFCLSVSFKSPHVQDGDPRQFIYNKRYSEEYKDIVYPRPKTADDKYWRLFPSWFRTNNEARNRWKIRFETDSMFRESIRGYFRLIQGVDDVVGNIVAELKKEGVDRNTIIIMAGDNGFFFGEHGLAGKWFAYEESVRIPLFIYNPMENNKYTGKVISDIALNIDIAPTILEYAGISKPSGMQGEPLQKTWISPDGKWRKEFYYEHRFEHPGLPKSEALISLDYKYINYYEFTDSSREFYDLCKDRSEVDNLINSAEYQDLIMKHINTLDSMRIKVK